MYYHKRLVTILIFFTSYTYGTQYTFLALLLSDTNLLETPEAFFPPQNTVQPKKNYNNKQLPINKKNHMQSNLLSKKTNPQKYPYLIDPKHESMFYDFKLDTLPHKRNLKKNSKSN